MTPIVAQTYTQPAPPVAQSTVAEIAVRSVSGATIAANAVAANPTSNTVINNRQQQTPIAEKSKNNQDVATLESRANPNALSNTSQSNLPSAPFLAQLIAQSAPESSADIAASFTTRTTFDAELVNDFSEVRYGPSYAAKPRPEPARVVIDDVAVYKAEPVATDIPAQPEVSETSPPVYSQLSRYQTEAPREETPINLVS